MVVVYLFVRLNEGSTDWFFCLIKVFQMGIMLMCVVSHLRRIMMHSLEIPPNMAFKSLKIKASKY